MASPQDLAGAIFRDTLGRNVPPAPVTPYVTRRFHGSTAPFQAFPMASSGIDPAGIDPRTAASPIAGLKNNRGGV